MPEIGERDVIDRPMLIEPIDEIVMFQVPVREKYDFSLRQPATILSSL